MDRILDSGSNDWGSTPHGDTRKRSYVVINKRYTTVILFSYWRVSGPIGLKAISLLI